LLRAYAEAVERLDGRFITGCDMGLQSADVAVMTRVTRYVSHTMAGSEVDTADLAALGVFESIRATAGFLGRELNGLRVAVQGLGQVGARLARQLAHAGARLWIADLDSARVSALAAELEAIPVAPAAVYDLPVELFSPNAGGSVLNDATIPRLRCRAVVGGANDQLAEPRHGDLLDQRGIAYAPDYLVNAGGLMSLLYETGALDLEGVRARVRGIGPRLLALLERARAEALAPHRLADRMVEQRLAAARAAAREPSR
jgi:leucine dehydrogenase